MTVKSVPEFLVDATNVYRTKGYIVKQQITLHDSELGSYLLSRDTYYRCTDKRDREFEEAFAYRINKKYIFEPKAKRRKILCKELRPYCKDDSETELFVELNLRRKQKNLIARRIRMTRKANLQAFNYFVTLTYGSAIHTEDSFRKKLRTTLSHFCDRKGWRYMGVWERSPEKKRLHFHGIFYIPDGTLSGEMEDINSFNFTTRRRQITKQNSFFAKRFGRNDFEKIEDKNRLGDALAYIMKYIEKSGEKIVYSRGLAQFFISDVMDEDIVCLYGMEEQKFLLYDDFGCWDEGEFIGQVSRETIAKMPKAN